MTQYSSALCAQPLAATGVDEEAMSSVPSHTGRVEIPTLSEQPWQTPRMPGKSGSCCTRHETWDVLFQHLLAEFPTVPPNRVLTLLSQANFSLDAYGLDISTTLEMAETVARYQLGMTVADNIERGRLDP
jgi:hypothetical protein